jgi:diguanylate cyclase (GGDEF)-like protein/PAS domain S-box-containing protein
LDHSRLTRKHRISSGESIPEVRSSRKLSRVALALALLLSWRLGVLVERLATGAELALAADLLCAAIALLLVLGMQASTLSHAAQRRTESRHRAVVESAMEAIVLLDEKNRILYANPAVEWMFGFRPRELDGKPFSVLAPASGDAIDRALAHADRRSVPDRLAQFQGVRADGRVLELEVTFGQHEEDGRVMRTGILRDVTTRENLQAQLRRSEERYLLAARGANDGLWDWNLVTGEVFFSQRWKCMLGIEGRSADTPDAWFSRLHPDDGGRVYSRLLEHLDNRCEHFQAEYRIRHADGSWRWMLCRGLAVRDEHGIAQRIAGSQTDISDRKHAEERLLYDAQHDSLTGLPNRVLLLERLSARLSDTRERGAPPCAVLFVDLDRFKNVNDSLGHACGDRLLRSVARKLEQCVRKADTVARFGGDEFAILLGELESHDSATCVAQRVLDTLSQSIRLQGNEIVATASIGVVWGHDEYASADDLLRDADAAMYRAKELGKARFEVFDSGIREASRARLSCEADLRQAVERGEIEVAYQPIVELASGRLTGFEALARWQRAGVPVPPAEFIPVAEETGLIGQIECAVARKACDLLAGWQRQFPLKQPLVMSINISGRHLRDASVVSSLSRLLEESQPQPGSVRLEITESLLLANDVRTMALLCSIKNLGFKLAIDDFGTGYSSLSYLHRLPVDTLKLDRSFVQGMEGSKDRVAIVSTVVALAKQLKLAVVAEGVETEQELERVQRCGCDMVQGFFFARPLSADDAAEWVAREAASLASGRSGVRRRAAVLREAADQRGTTGIIGGSSSS